MTNRNTPLMSFSAISVVGNRVRLTEYSQCTDFANNQTKLFVLNLYVTDTAFSISSFYTNLVQNIRRKHVPALPIRATKKYTSPRMSQSQTPTILALFGPSLHSRDQPPAPRRSTTSIPRSDTASRQFPVPRPTLLTPLPCPLSPHATALETAHMTHSTFQCLPRQRSNTARNTDSDVDSDIDSNSDSNID